MLPLILKSDTSCFFPCTLQLNSVMHRYGVKCNEKLMILKYGKIRTKNWGNVFIRSQRYQTHNYTYMYMYLTPINTFEE